MIFNKRPLSLFQLFGYKSQNNLLILLFILIAMPYMAQSPEYKQKKAKQLAERSPFQDELDGKYPDHLVYQDDDLMVFQNNAPQLPVHLLVVPRKRIATLNDLTPEDEKLVGKMILTAKRVAKEKGIAETGYRLTFNTNEDAGQSVFHIHLHLLGGSKTGPIVDQAWRRQQKIIANSTFKNEVKKDDFEKYIQAFKDTTHFQGTVLVVVAIWIAFLAFMQYQNNKIAS